MATKHVLKGPKGRIPVRKQSSVDRLLSFISQLTLLAVWKTITTVSAPFGKVIAFYLWWGKIFFRLTSFVQRVVYNTVGWLSGPALPRSHWLRRWGRDFFPLDVKRWHVTVAIIVAGTLLSTLFKKWQERFDERLRRIKAYRAKMKAAASYQEWRDKAQKLESLTRASGAHKDRCLYDQKLLQNKAAHLRRCRDCDPREMMSNLRTDLIRNIANISKCQDNMFDVPAPIKDYINEVKDQLNLLTDWPDSALPAAEKITFFKETRHTFGRTALLLSGGGGLGCFHVGVVKALFEQRLLPRVLAGSSVGSIVAAIIATKTDEQLRSLFSQLDQLDISFFSSSSMWELLYSLVRKGHLQDCNFLQSKLKRLVGDTTFLEAYERTGRILNVTVCPADTNEPPRLLNFLTAPNALVWSAVAASAAFPGLFPAQNLLAKNAAGETVRFNAPAASEAIQRRWRDGSLELDLPTFLLSEMLNCNHFLVSQTNPHIAPLLNFKKSLNNNTVARLAELELKHRCEQLRWILPDWVPHKWLNLFTQPWEGDVTMTLPASMWNLGRTITNPNSEELLMAVRVGEQTTWEKLATIQCNCTIEATLDQCLVRVLNKAREQPMAPMRSRIPSWLHMAHIGQPAIASWGGLDTTGSGMSQPILEGSNELDVDTAPPPAQSWGAANVADSVEDWHEPRQLPRAISGSTISSGDSSLGGLGAKLGSDEQLQQPAWVTMAQLDCCDTSVLSGLWSDLLPLATSSIALSSNPGMSNGEALDFIAP